MSTADESFDAALAALTRMVVSRETLEQSLQRVADLALAHVAGADSVSVTIIRADGRPRTAACSDGIAVAVDEAQYEADDGPCLDAYRSATMVRVDSILGANRWPSFETAALHQGVRASLSAPLLIDEAGVGAVNIYAKTESAWTAESETAAGRLADQAAVAVANTMLYHDAMEAATNLERAIDTRDLIGQAKGILMERHKLTADEAFARLREVSQRQNLKLRDVAHIIAETGAVPSVDAVD